MIRIKPSSVGAIRGLENRPVQARDTLSRLKLSAANQSRIRCDDFTEQRKHGCMAPHVVDSNQCGSAVLWTQGFEREVVRSI